MAVGGEIRAAVTAEAERAKGIAQGLAADFAITGEYEGSFFVTSDTTRLTTAFRNSRRCHGKTDERFAACRRRRVGQQA